MSRANAWQSILTGALLLCVGAACGAIVVKLTAPAPSPTVGHSDAPPASGKAGPASPPRAFTDGVLVYLFHGNVRCKTCLAIEANTKEALQSLFAEAIDSGQVIVKEINYEQPENQAYIQKYQIIAPTVVMVRVRDGQEVRYENLMDVWQLVDDKEKFHQYIAENLRTFLASDTT